ncbi:TRAP transporter permease DctQ [Advenella sp. S44]|uniref:TRAP transporter small permease subunit n=1 Tax=Advenella sp. S44 TaxID=1982755 RepID=UPI000C2B3E24|nr:TRAP transporter small permease subunit [Advenella sp. S44]PJX25641.1 TRAP transporter permease DctQ [Advenella sp. S44]
MPSFVSAFILGITRINKFFFNIASLLIFVIVFSMLYEVVSRYVFNAPTIWGMELATLLFGPYFLLGGAYLLHLRGHVNLDLLKNKLSQRNQRLLDLFAYVIIIVFSIILFSYSFSPAMQAWDYKETSFSAWNPPVWPVKFAIPISVLLLGLQSFAEMLTVLYKEQDPQS